MKNTAYPSTRHFRRQPDRSLHPSPCCRNRHLTNTNLGGLRQVLTFLVLSLVIVAFMGCDRQTAPKVYKTSQYKWRGIKGEFCSVNIDQEKLKTGHHALIVAQTTKHETALCISNNRNDEATLIAIANPNQCKTNTGKTLPKQVFTTMVVKVATKSTINSKPVYSGSVYCNDKYDLAGGGRLKLEAFAKGKAKEEVLPVAISEPHGIYMRINQRIPATPGIPKELAPEGEGFLGHSVDVECDIDPGLHNAIYGMKSDDGTVNPAALHPTTMIICDDTVPRVLCEIEITPDMRLGIVGNELNNRIAPPHSRAINCGDAYALAPNPDWNLLELWLVGMGGEDTLIGIDDADTRNGIFGDYLCSPPTNPAPPHEYIGTGGGDSIIGGPGNDNLFGEEGNDYISGGDGDDLIYGAYRCDFFPIGFPPDNDDINGGAGNDTIFGDTGSRDSVYGGRDSIFGMTGDDTIMGGPAYDEIFGDSFAWAGIPPGNDRICGDAGEDALWAGEGCDTVHGNEAEDIVIHLGDGCPAPGSDTFSAEPCPYY